VQQWVGLINEIMNVNSLVVLKSNHCYQRNGQWKACIPQGSFIFVQWDLTFRNLNKYHLLYSASYFNMERSWSFVSEGLSPPKPPWRRDCVAKLQLFNAIDSEKYGICQTFCL